MKRSITVGVAAASAMLLLVNVAQVGAQQVPRERTIHMTALEYKGTANADEGTEPAAVPGTLPLAPVGSGYLLKNVGSTAWQVSTYRFEPGSVTVAVGDVVTLEIVGINGKVHHARLIPPVGDPIAVIVARGRLTRTTFQPTVPGTWRLVCDSHVPGMRAEILVTADAPVAT